MKKVNLCHDSKIDGDLPINLSDFARGIGEGEYKYKICNVCGYTAIGIVNGEIKVCRNGNWENHNENKRDK